MFGYAEIWYVPDLSDRGSADRMAGKERCEHLPKKEDEGEMLDARDSILVRCPRSAAWGLLLIIRQASKISKISSAREREAACAHTMPPDEPSSSPK